jgi:predicted Zn-dependent peptidase
MGRISYQVVNSPPQRPLEGYNSLEASVKTPTLNATTLSNGLQVFTESSSFPSHIHMGVLVNAGTRDETMYNSGVCFALKNVFLKTNERTNE